jgi:pSer/pThr/pTyr-binding forkhead associated (FHA) protein
MSGPVLLVLRLLITASLYAFLGWALWALWRDVQQQSALLSNRKIPTISLNIRPFREEARVRHFVQPEILIGRDLAADVRDDDETLSARHARLAYHHRQWWLEDLQSTNGTFLNRERLYTPTVVVSGDQVDCGSMTLTIGLTTDSINPPTQKIPPQVEDFD